MKTFDPRVDIVNAKAVLGPTGEWQSFHDAEIYSISFWSGDVRPDDSVWIGPELVTSIGILGPKGEMPYAIVRLKFKDCDQVRYSSPNLGRPGIYDLEFFYQKRGYLNDGVTPLTPYIFVCFSNGPKSDPLLTFRCMTVEAIGREAPSGPPFY